MATIGVHEMAETNAARGSVEPAPRVEYELQLYYWMKLIRAFEERVSRLHRQNKILGGVYSGAGQEAIVTGICAPLHDCDFVARCIATWACSSCAAASPGG